MQIPAQAPTVNSPQTHEGVTIWLTGMSGAGKSTLSQALAARLRDLGLPVEILDGDIVREYLSQGLGYSREDRDTNVRRIGFVAGLLARHGVFVITAAISPYAESRREARSLSPRFIEVFVNAPLETLISRDPKGLYEKALKGEIANFTGVSDPYEAPEAPDIEIRTDQLSVDEGVERIMAFLFTPHPNPLPQGERGNREYAHPTLSPRRGERGNIDKREGEIDGYWESLNREFEPLSAEQRLARAFEIFGSDRMVFSSAFGAMSAGLCHLVSRVAPGTTVYFLETGFHFQETLDFRDALLEKLPLTLEILHPAQSKAELMAALGDAPYDSQPDECCRINKVDPMARLLERKRAEAKEAKEVKEASTLWISGLRRDQNQQRAGMTFFQYKEEGVYKLHPILDWSRKTLHHYIVTHHLPFHPLWEKGYVSIGCAPCTAPCGDPDDERAGRWQGSRKTECGLHLESRS